MCEQQKMNMNIIEQLEQEEIARLGKTIPAFAPGDTVVVQVKVKEGDKERIQVFTGTVIARDGHASTETFTVRRISFNVGVERVFPLHSPSVEKIEVERHGKARRAKLYYLRERTGKKAKVKERRV